MAHHTQKTDLREIYQLLVAIATVALILVWYFK